ncbi:uncharacterized protein LOC142163277 [Nicotiana tabacum]|uniref:Uncharacterized protein LOC142163277 n=1 Tax=Nicotiana tabacum TaxID=4097 RepID=A0AC58RV89_TOBAC
MSSVAQELRKGIVYSSNAQKVWEAFKERFDKVNATKVYHMNREIGSLTQGISSISIYYSRLNDLWAEFESMIPFPGSDCEESQRLSGNLGTQSGILGSSPMDGESSAMISINASNTRPRRNGNVQCDYCHMKGHTKENCDKLIGYPTGPKFNNNSRRRGGYNGAPAMAHNTNVKAQEEMYTAGTKGIGQTGGLASAPIFTHDQYQQILMLLDKNKGSDVIEMANMAESTANETANMAGKSILTMDLLSGKVKEIGSEKNGLYILNPYTPSAAHVSKCYRLYDIEFGNFFVNRDVVFKEHIFPFKFPISHFLPSKASPPSPFHPGPSLNPIPIPSLDSVSSIESSPSLVSPAPSLPTISPDTMPTSPTPSPTSATPVTTTPDQPRRLGSVTRPSIWLTGYVHPPLPTTSSSSSYPIQQFVSYSHLPSHFRSFLASFSSDTEPSSFSQASKDVRWVKAMQLEIEALEQNYSWEVVDLPSGKIPVGCKWVYKIKYNADGSVERFKARLVAKGYTQQEGLDFHDTFSPVAKLTTVRTVVVAAALKGWLIFQMDVHNAFLNGDLEEEVDMSLPQGFSSQREHKVYRLLKSLCGLKQASREWNLKLTQALKESSFTQSKHDYSLFTKTDKYKIVLVLVYVDDLLVIGNDLEEIQNAKAALHQKFKLKDLGELRYFLGIEFARSKEGILMSQRKYTLEMISDVGLAGSKPKDTPMEQNMKLNKYRI